MTDNPRAGTRQETDSRLAKPAELISLLVRPYRFGFITGHSYIPEGRVAEIRAVLAADDAEKERITRTYAANLAGRIGPGQGVTFASARMALYTVLDILGIG